MVLAGMGGAGAILLVSGSLVGSILAGAGSSGERRQEQGWGWDRYCQTRVGQEALPAGDMPWPRGPAPGSSLSFPLLQPRTHPGGSLSSPSLSFAVVAAAEEQRGLEKDPCYSLSPPHISPTPAPHQPHCGWRFLCVWWSRRLQSSPEHQHCGTGRMSSRHQSTAQQHPCTTEPWGHTPRTSPLAWWDTGHQATGMCPWTILFSWWAPLSQWQAPLSPQLATLSLWWVTMSLRWATLSPW